MHGMLEELFGTFDAQLQFALMVLILVMGAMIWRAHRQISKLAQTSGAMRGSLGKLEQTTDVIVKIENASTTMQESLGKLEGMADVVTKLTQTSLVMQRSLERLELATNELSRRTQETEETLRSNLEEYRMALGSTSAYRDYLHRMGMAPASDVEPILEAIPDGAWAISLEGKILYANRAFGDMTSIAPGASLEEIVRRCNVRSFDGESMDANELPEAHALAGEVVTGELIRMHPPARDHDVILSVNGRPARDQTGKVVAAVMLCREVSEEIAMAIEVRRMAEGRPGPVADVG
jgi:PAS domain S-box-containing protein